MDSGQPRSARPYVPSSLCGDVESMMIDMVLTEIQNQIGRIEDEQEQKRQESLRETQSPDYSWLMDWKLKNKKVLNFRECSAVELLCQKIKPNEWSLLIRTFRSKVRYVDSRDGVIEVFRGTVDEVRQQRGDNVSMMNVDETEDETWRSDPIQHRSLSVVELSSPRGSPKSFSGMENVV
ncbi:unnamed protein product [Bursaphelenchus xylophilus]|uniref:(pine wood nematode) hypothetical protein n=1 Tax=Bursaphelenchus xylophilus TaxID=6326 RepID=A0A1I7S358_BURXY|nr:unnamed protein product [Bursaphelenchus xylophilus]CAG9116104.1 unnamed protein product [Bursaphelenchus xylophilus]